MLNMHKNRKKWYNDTSTMYYHDFHKIIMAKLASSISTLIYLLSSIPNYLGANPINHIIPSICISVCIFKK